MVGWLAKRGQNARVYMCIKEVKWELEMAASIKRATILALAQLLRTEAFSDTGLPVDVFDRPFDYSRHDLMCFYELLETTRNQNAVQIEAIKKNIHQRLGMELPPFVVEHAKTMRRGLEVWMCTLGAGIAPERRDDVRIIWTYLADSFDHIGQAVLNMRDIEQQTAAMTGMRDLAVFSVTDTSDWIDICRFVPSVFVKELHSY